MGSILNCKSILISPFSFSSKYSSRLDVSLSGNESMLLCWNHSRTCTSFLLLFTWLTDLPLLFRFVGSKHSTSLYWNQHHQRHENSQTCHFAHDYPYTYRDMRLLSRCVIYTSQSNRWMSTLPVLFVPPPSWVCRVSLSASPSLFGSMRGVRISAPPTPVMMAMTLMVSPKVGS